MAEEEARNMPAEAEEDDRTFVLEDEETGEEHTAFILRKGEVAVVLGGSANDFTRQLVTAGSASDEDEEGSDNADASEVLATRLALAFLGRLGEEPEFIRDMLDWYEEHLGADAEQDEE